MSTAVSSSASMVPPKKRRKASQPPSSLAAPQLLPSPPEPYGPPTSAPSTLCAPPTSLPYPPQPYHPHLAIVPFPYYAPIYNAAPLFAPVSASQAPQTSLPPHSAVLAPRILPKLEAGKEQVLPLASFPYTASNYHLMSADEREQARKMSHSAIERRRRERINDKISQLRQVIPSCADMKDLHKLTVLQSAIDYISFLKDLVARLDKEKQAGALAQETPASSEHGESERTATQAASSYQREPSHGPLDEEHSPSHVDPCVANENIPRSDDSNESPLDVDGSKDTPKLNPIYCSKDGHRKQENNHTEKNSSTTSLYSNETGALLLSESVTRDDIKRNHFALSGEPHLPSPKRPSLSASPNTAGKDSTEQEPPPLSPALPSPFPSPFTDEQTNEQTPGHMSLENILCGEHKNE